MAHRDGQHFHTHQGEDVQLAVLLDTEIVAADIQKAHWMPLAKTLDDGITVEDTDDGLIVTVTIPSEDTLTRTPEVLPHELVVIADNRRATAMTGSWTLLPSLIEETL